MRTLKELEKEQQKKESFVFRTMLIYFVLIICAKVLMIQHLQAGETVTIVDPSGDIQICKVTESGAIVCL